jgi:FADH2 O2-dependent halogenase
MTTQRTEADVAIVGSGFAGSLAALALRQRGRRVVLIERGTHPRFVIGESTTPLTNILLEELADRYNLPRIKSLSKWGTWQDTHSTVPCGLKRGFTFVFHRLGGRAPGSDERPEQLLVAASPHDRVADTHWYRPALDHMLVEEAIRSGAVYLDRTALSNFDDNGTSVTLSGSREGRRVEFRAPFVLDASGPRGFLANHLSIGDEPLRWLPKTQGLYTHFEGVGLWEEIRRPQEPPPYPPDDAALHHVFPGGWIWVLRFNNGLTSAGAALEHDLAEELRVAEGEPAWHRLLDRLPSVREQFRHARPTLPFMHSPRIGFRCSRVAGERWALLPSAAGVIDPLLSTGFPLTLLGLQRLLNVLETTAPGAARQAALQAYDRDSQDELDVTERLVGSLYANMSSPAVFTKLTMLYFAAASFSETVRRLGRPGLAPGFLLHKHPEFGRAVRECADLGALRPTGAARQSLFDRLDRAIEPFDTAGLLQSSPHGYYPVRRDDLIRGAHKLEATEEEIARLLARCGLA